jgi:hypothetical protein
MSVGRHRRETYTLRLFLWAVAQVDMLAQLYGRGRLLP